MTLTYGNLVRGLHLVLFSASSILCLFKPSEFPLCVALLNLAGLIVFELISNSKRPEVADHSKEIEALKQQNLLLERNFQVIRDNISVASASGIIRR
jgi:hypothetical protein